MKQAPADERIRALQDAALRHPGVEKGVACAGTALESTTFRTRGKAFLFLRRADARLKLQQSLPAAIRMAAEDPDRYQAGANGWVMIRWGGDGAPPVKVLVRWIDESRRVVSGEPTGEKVTCRPVRARLAKAASKRAGSKNRRKRT
jgi:hypothetical protein